MDYEHPVDPLIDIDGLLAIPAKLQFIPEVRKVEQALELEDALAISSQGFQGIMLFRKHPAIVGSISASSRDL